MPNLAFISAPELVPLTHTKGDLVLQAGLNGAPQHLPLKNDFKYDNHLSEDHHAADVSPLPSMLSLCQPPGLQVLGRLSRALFQVLLGLFKLIALKFSMRLNNEAFRIGILRRRQELRRTLYLKCL